MTISLEAIIKQTMKIEEEKPKEKKQTWKIRTIAGNFFSSLLFLGTPSNTEASASVPFPGSYNETPLSWKEFVRSQNPDTFIQKALAEMNRLRCYWVNSDAEPPYRFPGNMEHVEALQKTAITLNRFPTIAEEISFTVIAEFIKSFLSHLDQDLSEDTNDALFHHFVDILHHVLYYQCQRNSPVDLFFENFPELSNEHILITKGALEEALHTLKILEW